MVIKNWLLVIVIVILSLSAISAISIIPDKKGKGCEVTIIIDFGDEYKAEKITWKLVFGEWVMLKEESDRALWIFEKVYVEKPTPYDALLCAKKIGSFSVSSKYYSNGYFVESIGGIENGKNGKYWFYYVNKKFGEVSSSNYIVKNNDLIEWRFEASVW